MCGISCRSVSVTTELGPVLLQCVRCGQAHGLLLLGCLGQIVSIIFKSLLSITSLLLSRDNIYIIVKPVSLSHFRPSWSINVTGPVEV